MPLINPLTNPITDTEQLRIYPIGQDPINIGDPARGGNQNPGAGGSGATPLIYSGAIQSGGRAYTPDKSFLYGDGGIGQVEPYVREVRDQELVRNQLDAMLRSDSRYMEEAEQRGIEIAGERKLSNSTLAAGAAQREAIRAAAPIAESDANAFRAAASENAAAMNNFALAKMDSLSRLKLGKMDASTRMYISDRQSGIQKEIAEMQIQAEMLNNDLNRNHDVAMETLLQGGRVELANLDAELRTDLAAMGIQGEFDLAQLGFEEQRMVQEYQSYRQEKEIRFEYYKTQQAIVQSAYSNYAASIASLQGQDLDEAAYARALDQAETTLINQLQAAARVEEFIPTPGWLDFGG